MAEAEAIYRQILSIEPQNARALDLLGIALHQQGKTGEAIDLLRQATQIDPTCSDFHSNLGVLLTEFGLYEEALPAYRNAIRLDPRDPHYHWNLAINLLSSGSFRDGWEEFEWRLTPNFRNLDRGFLQPRWDGSDLAGKTILLYTEGGFGDAIQFIRYVPLIAARGARIILECQPELVRLFERIPQIAQIFRRFDSLSHFDFQIPLQSLPQIFHTDLSNIPASIPYLSAPPEISQIWKQRLASELGRKIGIAWAGSNLTSGKRSKLLDVFAPLANIPGIRLFSLQKGREANQPPPPGLSITNYTDQMQDFADLAAFIQNLDLVISVDTSVVHLAGALAMPVWTLVSFVPDFRWLRDRTDSPWYPTMRLFRQQKAEPWPAVIERIAQTLA